MRVAFGISRILQPFVCWWNLIKSRVRGRTRVWTFPPLIHWLLIHRLSSSTAERGNLRNFCDLRNRINAKRSFTVCQISKWFRNPKGYESVNSKLPPAVNYRTSTRNRRLLQTLLPDVMRHFGVHSERRACVLRIHTRTWNGRTESGVGRRGCITGFCWR